MINRGVKTDLALMTDERVLLSERARVEVLSVEGIKEEEMDICEREISYICERSRTAGPSWTLTGIEGFKGFKGCSRGASDRWSCPVPRWAVQYSTYIS